MAQKTTGIKTTPPPGTIRMAVRLASFIGLAACVAVCAYGWYTGIFSSTEKLQQLISGLGIAGILVFIIFQAAQVVVPIVPGGLGCLAGVLLFGAWKGFLWNYVGICAGSVLAFLIAKSLGRPLLYHLFSHRLIQKYEVWTSERMHFSKMFALAIFLPVAPDDFLCYLAGTTRMTLTQFTAIILLCKPFAIALYSLGLMTVFSQITQLIGG